MADQWLSTYDDMMADLSSPQDTAKVLETAATLYASFKDLPGVNTDEVDKAAGSVLNEMYNEVKGKSTGGRRRTRRTKKSRKFRR